MYTKQKSPYLLMFMNQQIVLGHEGLVKDLVKFQNELGRGDAVHLFEYRDEGGFEEGDESSGNLINLE